MWELSYCSSAGGKEGHSTFLQLQRAAAPPPGPGRSRHRHGLRQSLAEDERSQRARRHHHVGLRQHRRQPGDEHDASRPRWLGPLDQPRLVVLLQHLGPAYAAHQKRPPFAQIKRPTTWKEKVVVVKDCAVWW